MRIVIAGGHGQIALRLARLLAARGDPVVGMVRNPDHAGDLRAAGAEPVVIDLERATAADVAAVLSAQPDAAPTESPDAHQRPDTGQGPDLRPVPAGADAVVFAAGAGPGSGAARKDTVDRAAAALLADAATLAGVRRYLQISAIGLARADAPGMDPVFAAYLRAKAAAEDDLRARDLDWTILRPGRLTDEPGTGRVRLGPPPVPGGAVPRDDVAAVLVVLLDRPDTSGLTLELVSGDTPVAEAVAAVVR
jgi:uncharacterized protein YbjT (DUF2867 family)